MTYGRPRYAAWYMGDPPRKLVTRYIRWFVAPRRRCTITRSTISNTASDATRTAFLEQVGLQMEQL